MLCRLVNLNLGLAGAQRMAKAMEAMAHLSGLEYVPLQGALGACFVAQRVWTRVGCCPG